jgi:hypothetical protein
MPYTAYKTWTVGEILTASNMNIQVRDNGLEAGPAKVTTKGDILVAAALNDLRRLGVGADDKIIVAASVEATGVKWSGSLKLTDTAGNTLVVKTNVLVVDATLDRVGIGTAIPATKLDIQGGVLRVGGIKSGLAIAQSEFNLNLINPSGTDESARVLGLRTGSTGDSGSDIAFYTVREHEAGGTERVRIRWDGNIGLGTTDQFGGGVKVVGLADATTIPSTNPTGGLVVYSEGGVLKVRQSDGTIASVPAAPAHSIISDVTGLRLSGDLAAPGNNQSYGTTGVGIKGWRADPVVVNRATQAAIEAQTDEATYVSPNRVKNSPGVAKWFCRIDAAGLLLGGSYNVASVTDTGTGDRTVVIDIDFSDTNWVAVANVVIGMSHRHIFCNTPAVGSVQITISQESFAFIDHPSSQCGFGDQ